jgi:hypothetical protein
MPKNSNRSNGAAGAKLDRNSPFDEALKHYRIGGLAMKMLPGVEFGSSAQACGMNAEAWRSDM